MKNVVITSGGTSEYIDKVRKITNVGTGKLGSMIADEFAKRDDVERIFYIHTKGSHMPKTDKYLDVEVTDTMSVRDAVEQVLTDFQIDVFIHSMAISDYMVDYVSTAEMLAQNIATKYCRPIQSEIVDVLKYPSLRVDNSNKISSNEDNLIVMLKPTPKIIGMIKDLSPNTKLVGFKLLEDVTVAHLIEVAREQIKKNKCSYVVANDLKDIRSGVHIAYLVTEHTHQKIVGKEAIAAKLASLF